MTTEPDSALGSKARALLRAAWLGLATSLLVLSVDYLSALSGDVLGTRLELGLGMVSLLPLVLLPLAVAFGAWLLLVRWGAERSGWPSGALRIWLFAALAGSPILAAACWVPWSWLSENAATFRRTEKLSAAGLYVALSLAAIAASRLVWWGYDQYRASPTRLPRWHWPWVALALTWAGVCYWADRTQLVDLYEDFHFGLAGGFVLGAAACALGLWATLQRRRPQLLERLTRPSPLGFGACAALLVCCGLLQLSRVGSVRATGALVFSKATLVLLHHSDFDGDGYSSLLGGLDCAPFDASRGPKQFDLPGNDLDEDCSGSDARWPKPKPAAGYAIPNARGFNVLFISIDTVRADRTSLYGNRRKTTPRLERLAAESQLYERAYSQSSKTYDSVPSILTGLYPSNLPRDYGHKLVRGLKPYMYTLTEDATLLSELAAAKGYQTRAVVSIPWLESLGLARGFRKFEMTTKGVTGKATKFLRGARSPFFLWLHYVEPHGPYEHHAEFGFGENRIDRYDSEIAYVDAQIGQVLDELAEQGLADKTVVVVTADHGEEFREHGGDSHASKLYQELLQVPLLIKVPGQPPARVTELVELVDIAPSLCEALALRPSCKDFDGQSLWATRAGQRDQGLGFRGAYSEAGMSAGVMQRRSLRTNGFRFSLDLSTESVELFDVAKDPREQHNLAKAQPERVREFRDEMALRPHRRLAPAFEAVDDSATSELVKALPLVRSEALLRLAVDALVRHPSPGSRQALEALKGRPGIARGVRAKLKQALAAAD